MNKKRLKKLLAIATRTMSEEDAKTFHTFLYQEYFELLYIIVKNRFPYSADDVFSDLFCNRFLRLPLRIYENSFDYLDQFMIRCTINFCNSAYKKKSKKQGFKKLYRKSDKLPNLTLKATEIKLDLQNVLKKIPVRQEKVFLLHCYLGYKHAEIVSFCNDIDSESISKQLLYRAKRNLRRYFLD